MGILLPLVFLMLCIGAAAWLSFIWAVKSGQYEDVEGPKYRMLDDGEEPGSSPGVHAAKPRGESGEKGEAADRRAPE